MKLYIYVHGIVFIYTTFLGIQGHNVYILRLSHGIGVFLTYNLTVMEVHYSILEKNIQS